MFPADDGGFLKQKANGAKDMCNIAGYVGKRRAAPILIEMLKKQETFDGAMATGIATIHEGRLYYRKIARDLETFLKETDAYDLPGNIGIIHSRPDRFPEDFAHPHISEDGKLAMVMNGTLKRGDKYSDLRDKTARLTEERGYTYAAKTKDGFENYALLSDGSHVPAGEHAAHLTAMYKADGYSYTEAFAKAIEDSYSDLVGVMITANEPDKIWVGKVSRPMNALVGDGEVFIASAEFAFDGVAEGNFFTLPPLNICEITAEGVKITNTTISTEKIAPITPDALIKAREIMCSLMREKATTGGCVFDDFEILLGERRAEIFDNPSTYSLQTEIIYHILYDLHKKGLLKSEERLYPEGPKMRRYMWIDRF